jgi:hypothetical protein
MNSAQNQAGPSGRIKPKNSSFAAVQRKKIPISENTDIPRLRELLKGTQDILLTCVHLIYNLITFIILTSYSNYASSYRCSATLRPSMEQRRSELEARITYLMSLGQMQKELHNTHLDPAMFSEQMDVEPDGSRPDTPVEDPLGSTVATKRRILETTSPNVSLLFQTERHPISHIIRSIATAGALGSAARRCIRPQRSYAFRTRRE